MLWPEHSLGSVHPEVGNWQRFLNAFGYSDSHGRPLVVDESFGIQTRYATATFQSGSSLEPTGTLSGPSRALAQKMGFIPFLPAKGFTQMWPGGRPLPTQIVIHTTEYPEREGVAVDVAEWFGDLCAPKYPAPQASAHYVVDDKNIIQCVRDCDQAWHAPGANLTGIGIEHAGFAKQSAEEWADDYSMAMLTVSAKLVAKLCAQYDIPVTRLSPEDLVAKKSGICGHVDVTMAFSGGHGHTDPGEHFIWDVYLALIEKEL